MTDPETPSLMRIATVVVASVVLTSVLIVSMEVDPGLGWFVVALMVVLLGVASDCRNP